MQSLSNVDKHYVLRILVEKKLFKPVAWNDKNVNKLCFLCKICYSCNTSKASVAEKHNITTWACPEVLLFKGNLQFPLHVFAPLFVTFAPGTAR